MSGFDLFVKIMGGNKNYKVTESHFHIITFSYILTAKTAAKSGAAGCGL